MKPLQATHVANLFGTIAVLLLGSTVASCGRFGASRVADGTIARDRYIEAVVALRRVQGTSGDSIAFRTRRDSVLQKLGLSAAELTRFAQVHGPDAAYMSVVWDSIEARLKAAASGPRPGPPPAPAVPAGTVGAKR